MFMLLLLSAKELFQIFAPLLLLILKPIPPLPFAVLFFCEDAGR